jgi:hypothetical protein
MKTHNLPLSYLLLTFLTFLIVLSAQAQVPSHVPTNGLVGYWPFNGNANDESGNGHNGTAIGATLTTDRFGNLNKAYSFNGGSQKIQTNYQGILGQNARSISLWYLSNPEGGLLYYGLTYPGARMNIYLYPVQYMGVYIASAPTIDNSDSQVAQNLITNVGSWNHLVITYDPSNGTATNSFKFYVNGVLSTQEYFNYNGDQVFNTQLGDLMMFGSVPGQDLYGKMDDIGMWNRALTVTEVMGLYECSTVGASVITGSLTPSQFTQNTYTCNNSVGSSYTWTATNGVIVSGQGTNTVEIIWANAGIGSVSVVETNAMNCSGDMVSVDVVIIPTNVEELSNTLILYPNPATTELNLQITSDLIGTDLFVFDALGKQILKQQILSTNTIINTSSFAVGNYVVKVGGGVKKFTVEK